VLYVLSMCKLTSQVVQHKMLKCERLSPNNLRYKMLAVLDEVETLGFDTFHV